MGTGSFKQFVEQKLGKVPQFFIYAFLEWVVMILLFIDGLIAFAANEFARFFELRIPCLLCTRIDHLLVHRDPDFYYNDSICEAHRKNVSSLAYCHIHQRLSDIRRMCEGCLLSFATENKSDCDNYKSLVGILGGDLECSIEDNHKIHLRLPAEGKEDLVQVEKSSIDQCSCCGQPLRIRASFPQGFVQSLLPNGDDVPQSPAPSPRGLVMAKNEESRAFDPLPHVQYKELRFMSDTESEIPEDDNGSSVLIPENQCREDVKAAAVPLLTECEDLSEDACKTPNFFRANRFFGVPPMDSATASPRLLSRLFKRSPTEKLESGLESLEVNATSEADGETILHRLKKQVRLDHKSLIAMYMELDEERNASAIAANQAMAMITRLQAEKAEVHMEALQYQRMMEEQAEYDQEALQVMKDMLIKREEEIKVLEAEIKTNRERSVCGEAIDIKGYNAQVDSSISEKSEWGNPPANLDKEVENDEEHVRKSDHTGPSQVENGLGIVELDFEGESVESIEASLLRVSKNPC